MRLKLVLIGVCVVLFAVAYAETVINGSRSITGNWDASGALTTKPCKAGTTAPGTCAVEECYFDTDATAGSNLLLCTATNTWTAITGGTATDAVADGTTKGVATFAAADFNSDGSGRISIDSSTWSTRAAVPSLETDAAHDTCSEISGCVVGAITGAGNAATATYATSAGSAASASSADSATNAGNLYAPTQAVTYQTDDDGAAPTTRITCSYGLATAACQVQHATLSAGTGGTITATTAAALSSNGSNCSAGSFPLGVSAAGAAESCTVAFTAAGVPAAETDSAHDTCAEISGCVVGAITAAGVPAAETDAAHDTCAEISGCVVGAITGSGNAATATALAANGANCSAGQAPLGVDASGAVEGCWTPGGGSGGNSFATIDAPSGTDPVADSTADTLAITCTGLTCTGDSSADSLAFVVTAPAAVSDSFDWNQDGTPETGNVDNPGDGFGTNMGNPFNGRVTMFEDFWQGPRVLKGAGCTSAYSMGDADPQTSATDNGMAYCATAASATADSYVGWAAYGMQDAAMIFDKMDHFAMRVGTDAKWSSGAIAVGGTRTSTGLNIYTKTDGIFFWCAPAKDTDNDGTIGDLDPDGTGAGVPDGDCLDAGEDADDCKWSIASMSNAVESGGMLKAATNTTFYQTSILCTQTGNVYQVLELKRNGSNYEAYINGVLQTTFSTNLPIDSRKIQHWGAWQQTDLAAALLHYYDWFYYSGRR